jgi:hypothetical protein
MTRAKHTSAAQASPLLFLLLFLRLFLRGGLCRGAFRRGGTLRGGFLAAGFLFGVGFFFVAAAEGAVEELAERVFGGRGRGARLLLLRAGWPSSGAALRSLSFFPPPSALSSTLPRPARTPRSAMIAGNCDVTFCMALSVVPVSAMR